MALLSSATVLRLVDSMAIVLAQAYQLARARLASAASPILRLVVQRDQAVSEVDLLRREAEIFRAQRESRQTGLCHAHHPGRHEHEPGASADRDGRRAVDAIEQHLDVPWVPVGD